MVNIGSLDLNRLLVLHAVLEARSVTRAAAKLHVTPSAISNALAQLRATFDDPLVVRSGRGLALTPRAIALAPQLAEAVRAIGRVLESRTFDPAASTRAYTLACSDAEQMSELPRIAAKFARKLPRASLRILSVEQLEAAGGLGSAEVDAAIAPAHGPSAGVYATDLYTEAGVLVARKDHPRLRKQRMTKALFNSVRHVDILLSLTGGGIGHRIVEEFFASHGLYRDIALSVPSFAAAAAIASKTDLVAGMPRRLATAFAAQMRLRVIEGPVEHVAFRMQLFWHERTQADPAARFLRSLVVAAIAGG